jgi:hypothetical protein
MGQYVPVKPSTERRISLLITLIHSPLVGPFSWLPVAERLKKRGWQTLVPHLDNQKPDHVRFFWEHHVETVLQHLSTAPASPVVLVSHSGAGVLLPMIGQALGRRVAGYIWVDAIIPENGKSRLDLFDTPEEAESLRQAATDGWLPVWTENDLQGVIPDPIIRRTFVEELNPTPLAVYEEKIPVPPSWPDAPCAYLRFSETYRSMAIKAEQRGWPCRHLDGSHFHLLVDADKTADQIEAFITNWQGRSSTDISGG